jgi:hypothetical protein
MDCRKLYISLWDISLPQGIVTCYSTKNNHSQFLEKLFWVKVTLDTVAKWTQNQEYKKMYIYNAILHFGNLDKIQLLSKFFIILNLYLGDISPNHCIERLKKK